VLAILQQIKLVPMIGEENPDAIAAEIRSCAMRNPRVYPQAAKPVPIQHIQTRQPQRLTLDKAGGLEVRRDCPSEVHLQPAEVGSLTPATDSRIARFRDAQEPLALGLAGSGKEIVSFHSPEARVVGGQQTTSRFSLRSLRTPKLNGHGNRFRRTFGILLFLMQ